RDGRNEPVSVAAAPQHRTADEQPTEDMVSHDGSSWHLGSASGFPPKTARPTLLSSPTRFFPLPLSGGRPADPAAALAGPPPRPHALPKEHEARVSGDSIEV